MIADLRPYPEYRDSGLPCLGRVPAHWDVVPLCRVARPKSVVNCSERELLSVYLNRGVIKFSEVEDKRTNPTSEDLSRYQAVDPGDFVLNNQQAWRGSVGVSSHTGIVSPAYLVLSLAPTLNRQFANYLFRDRALVAQYVVCSKGVGSIQRNLYWPELKRAGVLIPPLEEQVEVARFLNWSVGQVHGFIRNRRRLIEVLNEQKQAIINRAVTRGLDPNVPLKPSGIGWLGNVPEHWSVRRTQSFTRVVRGGSPRPAGSPLYFHGNDTPWITVAEITKDSEMYVRRTSTYLTALGADQSRRVAVGTLLLTNSGATLGVPKLTEIEGCINDGVAAFLNIDPDVEKKYLYFYWLSQTRHLRTWVNLGAQPNLNTSIIGAWPVVVPSKPEQEKIVGYLESTTRQFAGAIDIAQREIDLVREYRTRLIADVVTGKVDVRHLAPAPGDEPVEPEELAESIEEDETQADDEPELVEEAHDAQA